MRLCAAQLLETAVINAKCDENAVVQLHWLHAAVTAIRLIHILMEFKADSD